MKTLLIMAHMDDESLSCGGLIRNRIRDGGQVFTAVCFGRSYDYSRESHDAREYSDFTKALEELGAPKHSTAKHTEGEPGRVGYYALLEYVEYVLKEQAPDEVVIPGKFDLNQDHRHLHDVCRIALRPCNLGQVRRILAARAFDSELREPSWFETMSGDVLSKKLWAINCYEAESRVFPHPRSPENVRAYHQVMGSKCGHRYAEVYDLILQR